MTQTDLAGLLAERTAALGDLAGLDHKPLRDLAPSERLRAEVASEVFREADRRIVRALRELDGPAELGPVSLYLTRDRANFVEADPATGRPIWMSPSVRTGWRALLYRYPDAARQNCPGIIP